jgi:hypothetical protein
MQVKYADFLKLEKLLENNNDVLKWLHGKYPKEIQRWVVLRSKMGRHCPMARGVLKLISYMESSNTHFYNAVESGIWQTP